MQIIDLSREIHHRAPVHPAHPPMVVSVWYDHSEKKRAGNTDFTSKALYLSLSDHAGTHVDAPVHFDSRPNALTVDQMPLDMFYTDGICLDLSQAPLRHAIRVPEMAAALQASGQEIRAGDTLLLEMGVHKRLAGTPAFLHDFPGLAEESVDWIADRGVKMFGVEAVSPAPEGEDNFKAHLACARRNITHIEGLANLDALVGKGRFRFIGFPLKIRGGTASPIRAVAVFE